MTRYVAEISSNHGGSLERALDLVDAAARCGFTDCKSQSWRIDKLFAPEALEARPELRARKRLEVPWEWHKPLANRCKEHGMGYGVSVFHKDHVRLAAQEADWLKVSSYSILDQKLIAALVLNPKPVVISTGMATSGEVMDALSLFDIWPDTMRATKLTWRVTAPLQTDVTLLHCVSAYPCPPHEANLRSIPYLRERFGIPVGWSDHTVSRHVVERAMTRYQAAMIELHFDLDDGLGEETGHSWKPRTLGWMTAQTTHFDDEGYYAWDGKSRRKAPTLSEEAERDWRADPSDGLRPLLHVREKLRSVVAR